MSVISFKARLAVVIFILVAGAGVAAVSYKVETVDSAVIVRGSITATSELSSPGITASIVGMSPHMDKIGVQGMSNVAGVSGFSPEGNGVEGISAFGNGVSGLAMSHFGVAVSAVNIMDETALLVKGKITKEMHPENRLTIYDDSGQVIGSWLFSFE